MPGKSRLELGAPGTPGLEVLERLGLEGGDCERRTFCELAVLGARVDASAAHRGLWKLANSIQEDKASNLGLTRVLKAVKSNSCSVLKCSGRRHLLAPSP